MAHAVDEASALASVAIDAAWNEMRHSIFVQENLDTPLDRLPDIGEAATQVRSRRAARILERIDAIDRSLLPHDLDATLEVAALTMRRVASEADRYWRVFDPMGIGFFAPFAPTGYAGGWLLSVVNRCLAGFAFDQDGDVDRYLGLVSDYARLVDQMRLRTEGQAARGQTMPLPALDMAVGLVDGLAAGVRAATLPTVARLELVGGEAARARIEERVDQAILPAFARLSALLHDPAYRAQAPERVGMAHDPGGGDLYADLVREHTTLPLTVDEVHAIGLQRMDDIRVAVAAVLARVGHIDGREFLKTAEADPAWRATDADAIAGVFQRYIDRLAPMIDRCFAFKPEAPYAAEALPATLSGAMTFGFYSPPGPGQPMGRYLFNAANLAAGSMLTVAALNYHELVPGHHMHVASQHENPALHPVRANVFINAFNEGWAEYAATLAGELGMYEAPEEAFGRLMMDAFLTSRLVVDTGLNALGWTLEEAADYMRRNTFLPDAEIRSETVRYACGMPGQALAYKLGEHHLMALREAMRARLGDRFDLRDFHDAVLRPGALPLPLVTANVERAGAAIEARPR